MSIFSFLFGDKNPPPVETTGITTSEIPKYIAEPTAQIIGSAMDVAKEGFVPYTGPRLAGFQQDELDAMQRVRDTQGVAGLRTGQAFTAATASGAPALTSVSPYMTDYMTNVADVAAGKLRDQSMREQQDIAAKAVGAGGLDNTRFAVLEAERQKNLQEGLGDLYTKAQASAYETALKAAQQAGKTQAGIGQIYGALGKQAQAGLMGDVSGLFDMGEAQRQITGAQNLATYQTPFYGLGQFASALRGAPTFQQYQSPSPILTGIGAATGIANMYG